MQRFHRLGSVGLGLIMGALTLHLLAMSFAGWATNTCKTCLVTYNFREWQTSLTQRCYRISMANVLNLTTDADYIASDPFTAYVCIPNKYLYAILPQNTAQCHNTRKIGPHNACTSGQYNPDLCKCEYTGNTKAILALSIIASIALGWLVFGAHFASYIVHDSILKWLIPAGFLSLMVAFISMFATLLISGYSLSEDTEEIIAWRQFDLQNNVTINSPNDTNIASESNRNNYKVSAGWSFGLEIVAAHFTLTSGIIYALMFLAKKRPDS